jgi:quercetin dioxygenase-like cupin family protein
MDVGEGAVKNEKNHLRKGEHSMGRIGRLSRSVVIVTLTSVIGWYIAPLPLGAEDRPKPSAKVLFEKVVDVPSKIKVLVRLTTFPIGSKTPQHTHKGPGPRYVMQGKVEVVEGGETHTYTSGEVFWESGLAMTAENVGDGESKVVTVELLPVE